MDSIAGSISVTVKAAYLIIGRDEGCLPKGQTFFWGGIECNSAKVAHIYSNMAWCLQALSLMPSRLHWVQCLSKLPSPTQYLNH